LGLLKFNFNEKRKRRKKKKGYLLEKWES